MRYADAECQNLAKTFRVFSSIQNPKTMHCQKFMFNIFFMFKKAKDTLVSGCCNTLTKILKYGGYRAGPKLKKCNHDSNNLVHYTSCWYHPGWDVLIQILICENGNVELVIGEDWIWAVLRQAH